MVPIAPLYLWLVLQGGFLCHKLDKICDKIFHHNRNITDLVMRIFHYKVGYSQHNS